MIKLHITLSLSGYRGKKTQQIGYFFQHLGITIDQLRDKQMEYQETIRRQNHKAK
jgi:hypothetical protein